MNNKSKSVVTDALIHINISSNQNKYAQKDIYIVYNFVRLKIIAV